MKDIDWVNKAPNWADRLVIGPLTASEYWANESRRILLNGECDYQDQVHINDNWEVKSWRPALTVADLKLESPTLHLQWRGRADRKSPWPDSGLPPIGTECEAFNDHLEEWIKVKVIDHQGSVNSAVCREIGTDKLWWSDLFRPVKTAEEIAAEARKDCIDEMTKVIRRMPYVRDHYLAERLYENGFRIELKDEQPCSPTSANN